MSKFKVGDRVRVIKYGHGIYMPRSEWELVKYHGDNVGDAPDHMIEEYEEGWFYDMSPEMVGQIGTVDHLSSDGNMYSLTEMMGKLAWYEEHQLELVESHRHPLDNLAEALRKRIEEHPEILESVTDKELLRELKEFADIEKQKEGM